MISIIVSSYQKTYFTNFEQSVSETIGVPYEIIGIDNPGLMGLCEAYNRGAGKAKYDLLCFCHEDLRFLTSDWGSIVANLFKENPALGLIGVAGSTYKTAAPAGWGYVPQSRVANIIQHYRHTNQPPYKQVENPSQKNLVPVICLDGVWMCTTKKIVQEIKFDQDTLKSFHCYDIDFSLTVSRKYKVAVTFDVLIEHYSEGRNDKLWVNENILFHRKWQQVLPVNLAGLSKAEIKKYETSAAVEFVHIMGSLGYSTKQRLQLLRWFLFSKYIKKQSVLQLSARIIGSFFKQKLLKVK